MMMVPHQWHTPCSATARGGGALMLFHVIESTGYTLFIPITRMLEFLCRYCRV